MFNMQKLKTGRGHGLCVKLKKQNRHFGSLLVTFSDNLLVPQFLTLSEKKKD